jgi:hypothetical protein
MWDDVRAGATTKSGAGWAAVKSSARFGKKEKWFNIRTCKSWRLAFLFARLQRALWEREDVAPRDIKPAATAEGEKEVPAPKRKGAPSKEHTPAKKARTEAAARSDTPTKVESLTQRLFDGSTAGKSEPAESGKGQPAAPAGKLSSVMERLRAKVAAQEASKAAEGA